ncbi:MAG: hypothetical protein U0263_03040 [Polyangiaceae bacterium]
MRPSFDLDSGALAPTSSRSGTGRHTLPDAPGALLEQADRISLGGVADEFFTLGERGEYEGGPLHEDAELPEPPPPVMVQRTPAMDARRALFVRGVAAFVGCMVAVLMFGVARARTRVDDATPASNHRAAPVEERAPKPVAPAAQAADPAPLRVEPPAVVAAPAPVPEPTPAPATPPKSRATSPAPMRSLASQVVSAPAAEPVNSPAPVRALPSVASFGAAPVARPQPATKIPTASF